MSQPEANFWKIVKKKLPAESRHWRIENRAGSGIPDVYIIWKSVPIWAELKVTKNNKILVSPTQISWHMAHSDSGGLSFFLAKHLVTSDVFLFEGRDARAIARTGLHNEPLYQGSLDEALSHMYEKSLEHLLRTAQCASLREAQPAGAAPGLRWRNCAS